MGDANEGRSPAPVERLSTGVAGLDEILGGGLPREHLYLVEGEAGTGKTTLGLSFLLSGKAAGEKVLYVSLSETEAELKQIAASHGWSLEGVHIYEMTAAEAVAQLAAEQTIFHPAEVELTEATDAIVKTLHEIRPERVVFDSVTEIRLMAEGPLRYRRQILGLRKVLEELKATAVLTSNQDVLGDRSLRSLVHGVIQLERKSPGYGDTRRRLQVAKMRGMPYREGFHDFRIETGGLKVFPRVHLDGQQILRQWQSVPSGVAELDALLGGGLETGAAVLVSGPTGTGKSVLVTLYAHSAARRAEKSAIFIFDERLGTFHRRAQGLGMEIEGYVDEGLIHVEALNTGSITPGEFADKVRRAVVEERVRIVVIDSLTGYLNAMPEEKELLTQMHELLFFLSQHGVLTLLVLTQHGILEREVQQTVAASYLADTVLLLRHFEAGGSVRQAISVVKQRNGQHEKTIRELKITGAGLRVGAPLTEFSGVLTGNPVYEGTERELMSSQSQAKEVDARG